MPEIVLIGKYASGEGKVYLSPTDPKTAIVRINDASIGRIKGYLLSKVCLTCGACSGVSNITTSGRITNEHDNIGALAHDNECKIVSAEVLIPEDSVVIYHSKN